MSSILAPLQHRDFRLLWLGQSVSAFGNRIYAIALPFLILGLGGSTWELGITATILGVSSLVFLVLGGAVADRLPRRNLILVTDFLAGCAVASLALLSWFGLLRMEHVYVATAVLGITSSFFEPAYTAIIPELVPRDILVSGNAARSVAKSLARTVGPAIGGIIVAVGGPALGMAIDAATFFVSFGALLLVRKPALISVAPRTSMLGDIRDGLRYVLSVPWLWMVAFGYALGNITAAGQGPVMLPLLVQALHGGAADLGLINSAYGVGALLGGLALGSIPIRRPGLAIYALEAFSALALALVGLVPVFPAIVFFIALSAATLAGSDIVWTSTMQRHIPGPMIGRATSITSLATYVLNPLGPLFAVLVVTSFGPAGAFVVTGLLAFLTTVGLFWWPLRRLDSLQTTGIDQAGRPAT